MELLLKTRTTLESFKEIILESFTLGYSSPRPVVIKFHNLIYLTYECNSSEDGYIQYFNLQNKCQNLHIILHSPAAI